MICKYTCIVFTLYLRCIYAVFTLYLRCIYLRCKYSRVKQPLFSRYAYFVSHTLYLARSGFYITPQSGGVLL